MRGTERRKIFRVRGQIMTGLPASRPGERSGCFQADTSALPVAAGPGGAVRIRDGHGASHRARRGRGPCVLVGAPRRSGKPGGELPPVDASADPIRRVPVRPTAWRGVGGATACPRGARAPKVRRARPPALCRCFTGPAHELASLGGPSGMGGAGMAGRAAGRTILGAGPMGGRGADLAVSRRRASAPGRLRSRRGVDRGLVALPRVPSPRAGSTPRSPSGAVRPGGPCGEESG